MNESEKVDTRNLNVTDKKKGFSNEKPSLVGGFYLLGTLGLDPRAFQSFQSFQSFLTSLKNTHFLKMLIFQRNTSLLQVITSLTADNYRSLCRRGRLRGPTQGGYPPIQVTPFVVLMMATQQTKMKVGLVRHSISFWGWLAWLAVAVAAFLDKHINTLQGFYASAFATFDRSTTHTVARFGGRISGLYGPFSCVAVGISRKGVRL
jgi:hypothetical protein